MHAGSRARAHTHCHTQSQANEVHVGVTSGRGILGTWGSSIQAGTHLTYSSGVGRIGATGVALGPRRSSPSGSPAPLLCHGPLLWSPHTWWNPVFSSRPSSLFSLICFQTSWGCRSLYCPYCSEAPSPRGAAICWTHRRSEGGSLGSPDLPPLLRELQELRVRIQQ